MLVHTKTSQWARRPFVLEAWQRDEIIAPLFGHVVWSDEHACYRRRYTQLWLELARKNGKSELLAGIALILLVADDEEGAEVYGAAKDTKQAGKVFEVAVRMVQLSPTLSARLTINKQQKRIVDEQTASYYEIVTSDAAGELGHNPLGIVFDEVLAQKSPDLWNALETAQGARVQPLMAAATTAGNDPTSWCAQLHDDMVRYAANPDLAPHVLVVMRNTPKDADPWDESNWYHANPALGRFLSIEALRREALTARESPPKENAFRQFRLNQWVKQVERWLPVETWLASADGPMVLEEQLKGQRCWGGFHIGRTDDIAALVLHFPGEERHQVLWRFFVPAETLDDLEERTSGMSARWVRDKQLIVTDGNIADYDRIRAQIVADADQFDLRELAFTRRGAQQLAQDLEQKDRIDIVSMTPGVTLAAATQEWERLVLAGLYAHGADPVATWMVDGLAVRRDGEENVWPDQRKSGDTIVGPIAAVMAMDRVMRRKKRRTGAVAM